MKGFSHATVNSFRSHRKDYIVGGIIAVLLIILGGYSLWSKNVWDGYEAKYSQWDTSTKQQITQALSLTVKSDQDRERKMAAIKTVSAAIDSAETSLCQVNGLISWQHFIKSLQAKEGDCREVVAKRGDWNKKLKPIVVYLEDEQAIAKVVAKSPKLSQVPDTEWEAQPAVWQALTKDVEGTTVRSAFNPVKQQASKATMGIEAAWKEVIAAHKAKDKARYIKAQGQLTQAYETLAETAKTDTDNLKLLLDKLPNA